MAGEHGRSKMQPYETGEELARRIAVYRRDPMAFFSDLLIYAARGKCRFGDVMADFQKQRFSRLIPSLLAVAEGKEPPQKNFWWEATKGASKDSDLAVALIWLLGFARRPLLVQVAAADQDQASEVRKAADFTLRANPWLSKRVVVRNRTIACEATGATAEIIPADLAGSHGARPDVLICNELHAVTKREFIENLMDNATKVPWGIRVIATNAGFLKSWQHEWRERARTAEHWHFDKFDKPAPWLSAIDIEDARVRNSASRFQRLWYGVWVRDGGDALDQADINAAVVLDGPTRVAEEGWVYGAGLDLGVKRDHSALVVLGTKFGCGRVRLVDCQSWRPSVETGRVDLIAVRQAVVAMHRRFNLAWCGYDPHQAQLMAQELLVAGVPMAEVPFAGKTLDLMAAKLLEAFRTHSLELYPDGRLIDDLGRLTIAEKKFGYKLESVSDAAGHADRAIALAIVLPVLLDVAMAEPDEEEEAVGGYRRIVT